jgi:uncharacterized protein with GYD domain
LLLSIVSTTKGEIDMTTYFLFGKYSLEALKAISAKRSKDAEALIKKQGGELKAGYALLGEIDLVLIAEFPDMEHAMKASIALTNLLGIAFRTAPAVSMEAFDKLVG